MSLIVTAYTQEGIVIGAIVVLQQISHKKEKNYINIAIVGINYSC